VNIVHFRSQKQQLVSDALGVGVPAPVQCTPLSQIRLKYHIIIN